LPDIGDITPKFMKGLFQGLSIVKIRRSALSPFLNACLFITIPCCIIAALCPVPLRYWVFSSAAVPLVLFSIASIFLLVVDRDRLHTEEHLERRQAMEIVEAKGQGVMVSPVDLVNMVNPSPGPKQLSAGTEGGEVSNV